MSTKAIAKPMMNSFVFDDFFKPWNEWFDDSKLMNKVVTVPPVNIKESNKQYNVSLAVPGMKKEDFKINIEGNMLTISAEKEENKEEKDEKFSRKEYSFSSFSRSFTIPDDVKQEHIDAAYDNGVLIIRLPRKEKEKNIETSKKISVK